MCQCANYTCQAKWEIAEQIENHRFIYWFSTTCTSSSVNPYNPYTKQSSSDSKAEVSAWGAARWAFLPLSIPRRSNLRRTSLYFFLKIVGIQTLNLIRFNGRNPNPVINHQSCKLATIDENYFFTDVSNVIISCCSKGRSGDKYAFYSPFFFQSAYKRLNIRASYIFTPCPLFGLDIDYIKS